jgi:hypothetical protein
VRKANQQFKSAGGESVDVGHLLRSVIIFSDLSVLVVSDSSWTWTIAAAQAGIGSVSCLPLSLTARGNLTCLRRGKMLLLNSVVLLDSPELSLMNFDLLLVEVFCLEHLTSVPWSVAPLCAALGPAKLFRLMCNMRTLKKRRKKQSRVIHVNQ